MSSAALTRTESTHDTVSGVNYLKSSRGIGSWLFSLDHKRIALMYLVGVLAATLVGLALACLIRLEMWTGGPTIPAIDSDAYTNLFTFHGAVMVFLVVIPGIPGVLGNFILPLMLGQKNVAFPRLNLFSFWSWLAGAACLVVVHFTGGLDTGWTLSGPYSASSDTSLLLAAVGVLSLSVGSFLLGLNFLVTIVKRRPDGMTWLRMPIFLWGVFAASLIQIAATPVFGVGLLLMALDRLLVLGLFDPAQGGDPLLFQNFFWFYAHPAVYIMMLPAIAVVTEIISVHSRRPVFGYRSIAWSCVAIALLNFLVWGNHLFVSGQSTMASVVFSLFSFLPAIPAFVILGNWLATLYLGSIRLNTVMLYGLGFISLFVVGALTGLFGATLSTDVHLHGTYFVVGHFHYIMAGSILWAFIGGLYHWWPKMVGRAFSEKWGRLGSLISLAGFNVAFFPMFIMGTRGLPRRHYGYFEEFTGLQQIATVGAVLLILGLFIAFLNLAISFFSGRAAPDNPWGAASLEWQTATPPTIDNFASPPAPGEPYALDQFEYDEATGGYVRN